MLREPQSPAEFIEEMNGGEVEIIGDFPFY